MTSTITCTWDNGSYHRPAGASPTTNAWMLLLRLEAYLHDAPPAAGNVVIAWHAQEGSQTLTVSKGSSTVAEWILDVLTQLAVALAVNLPTIDWVSPGPPPEPLD